MKNPIKDQTQDLSTWKKLLAYTVPDSYKLRFLANMSKLKAWEKTWSVRNHLTFYVLICLMVASGIMQGIFFEQDVRVFGLVNITVSHNESVVRVFHLLHELIASLLKLLIAVHILAVLKHQFVDKLAILKRMT